MDRPFAMDCDTIPFEMTIGSEINPASASNDRPGINGGSETLSSRIGLTALTGVSKSAPPVGSTERSRVLVLNQCHSIPSTGADKPMGCKDISNHQLAVGL